MLKKIFKDKSHNTLIQFFRYAIVGGIATGVDFGTYVLFTDVFSVYYLISNVIAFCTGLVTNYFLSVIWVFPVKLMKNKFLEFLVYGSIGAVGLGLNTLFLWFFTDILFIDDKISKIIAIALVVLWNFFARKYVLFRQAKQKEVDDSSGIST